MTYFREYTDLSARDLYERHHVLCSDLESILLDRNSNRFTNRSRYQRSNGVVKEVRELKDHYWREVDEGLFQDDEIRRIDEEKEKLKMELDETMKFSKDRESWFKDSLDEKDKTHREEMKRLEKDMQRVIDHHLEELRNEMIKYNNLEEKHLTLERKYNDVKKRLHGDDDICANKKQKIDSCEK